jgi:hypothetical protein
MNGDRTNRKIDFDAKLPDRMRGRFGEDLDEAGRLR